MRREAVVCLILAASILAVYWQVKDHEFVDYDDNIYITDNPHVQSRTDQQKRKLGFYYNSDGKLASSHLAFPHDGLPTIWSEPPGTPPNQRLSTHSKQHFTIFGFEMGYLHYLAKRSSGGFAGDASAPRRIGCLGS